MPDRDDSLKVYERVASVRGRMSPGQPAECGRPFALLEAARRLTPTRLAGAAPLSLMRETNGMGRAANKVAIS
jgi:hypothetical protein